MSISQIVLFHSLFPMRYGLVSIFVATSLFLTGCGRFVAPRSTVSPQLQSTLLDHYTLPILASTQEIVRSGATTSGSLKLHRACVGCDWKITQHTNSNATGRMDTFQTIRSFTTLPQRYTTLGRLLTQSWLILPLGSISKSDSLIYPWTIDSDRVSSLYSGITLTGSNTLFVDSDTMVLHIDQLQWNQTLVSWDITATWYDLTFLTDLWTTRVTQSGSLISQMMYQNTILVQSWQRDKDTMMGRFDFKWGTTLTIRPVK